MFPYLKQELRNTKTCTFRMCRPNSEGVVSFSIVIDFIDWFFGVCSVSVLSVARISLRSKLTELFEVLYIALNLFSFIFF